jgi:arabinose-5-phosphate isomerase
LKSDDELKIIAVNTLLLEAESVKNIASRVGDDFLKTVRHILASEGRVVITGIGKSAIIASKIVATLNSTGTPAVFMHAADAIHGDLGTIQRNDTVICISHSGNTPEIKALVPLINKGGNKLIALTGHKDSFLATQSDYVLDAGIEKEACPHNLAPTCSTTAQLAMGDALAVCLLHARDFSEKDFARFHPGGSLGKRLYLRVGDISSRHEKPQVRPDDDIRKVILEISSKRLGATAVVDASGLKGVITDGDLRRMLEKSIQIEGFKASDIMSRSPKTIASSELAVAAVQQMEKYQITQLIVTDQGLYSGFLHMHDLLKEGLM